MARKIFFSFHYQRDIWRANQVRNSWVIRPESEAPEFLDAASWEEVKRKGEDSIKRWINQQMSGTSVTVVLIGKETAERRYVHYEIDRSWDEGKGLIGVHIHNLKNQEGLTDTRGPNPFAPALSNIRTYDWTNDDGYQNIGQWVEAAYERAQSRQR